MNKKRIYQFLNAIIAVSISFQLISCSSKNNPSSQAQKIHTTGLIDKSCRPSAGKHQIGYALGEAYLLYRSDSINNRSPITWSAATSNCTRGEKRVEKFKIVFFSDATKRNKVDCSELLFRGNRNRDIPSPFCEIEDNRNSKYFNISVAKSKNGKVKANVFCKNGPNKLSCLTGNEEFEDYWFTIYDVVVDGQTLAQEIDPRIRIKN